MSWFSDRFRRNKKEPEASAIQYRYWSGDNMLPFDGEKTPHELGTPINYYLDYYRTRSRAWETFIKSDVVQNAIKKYCLWIVGSGLKLQSVPEEEVLKIFGIEIDFQQYSENVESLFRLYADMKESTYNMEMDLQQTAAEALKNAIVSGDVLCINRLNNGRINLECIDGYYVQNPSNLDFYTKAEKREHTIVNGVELDKKGGHVAYYVLKGDLTHKRVLAYGSRTKKRQAWLFYGMRYKMNSVRGMSLLTAVIESATKLDRYKEAEIGNAEENAKIPYTIEHGMHSDGENPMQKRMIQSFAKGKGEAPETKSAYEICEPSASKIALSTGKTVYNLPPDSTLKRNNFENDINFKDFFNVNIDIIFNTIGIPPEIAMDKFGGSYSSSRAALKSWEYKMFTDRINLLKKQYYKPYFDFWLDYNVLIGNVKAEGYLSAFMDKNIMVLEAYRRSNFIGATVPHIDPVKEVNAERTKLGPAFAHIPLTTPDQSCKNLNTGDFNNIIKKATNEKELSKDFIIPDDTDGDGDGDE